MFYSYPRAPSVSATAPEDLGRQVDEELPLLLHKNALGVVGHRRWGLQLGRHRDRVLHQRAAVVLGRLLAERG